MGKLHRLPPARVLFGDARGRGLRLTWHAERQLFTLSLWDGELCTGTIHLDPSQAARLVAVLGQRLADFFAEDGVDSPSQTPEAMGL